jgi:hypothetical protein
MLVVSTSGTTDPPFVHAFELFRIFVFRTA